MKSLYELSKEANMLTEALIESSGEISEELLKELVLHKDTLAVKASQYAFTMDKLEAESEFLKKKAKEYSDTAKRLIAMKEQMGERLKEYCLNNVVDKIEGENVTFKLVRSSPKVNVLDERLLPEDVLRIKTEITVNKEEIARRMKLGEKFEGVQLEETYYIKASLKK